MPVASVPMKSPVSVLNSVPAPEMETPCWALFEMTERGDRDVSRAAGDRDAAAGVARRAVRRGTESFPVGSVPMKSPVSVS